MTITLKNELLTVTIDDVGAQLCSVVNTAGSEYIWQADPAVWPRHAPLLFPVIGRLLNGQYTLDGQTYSISTHGFARDSRFDVREQSDTRVVFTLTDSPDTLEVYPFSFSLCVIYELSGNQLKKSCRVENRTSREMYYELGGHDGFCIPQGEAMDDYAIVLPGLDPILPYGMDEKCMLTPKDQPITPPNGRIPLKPMPNYGLDTIVLDAPPAHTAQLVNKDGQPRITLEFADYDYLGLWTMDIPTDTNYICIEPWTTLPDAAFVGRALSDKQGIRVLAPNASEVISYTTTFH